MKATIVAMLAVLLMLTACKPEKPVTEEPAVAVKGPDVMARVPILGPGVNVEGCWTVFEIGPGGNPHAQVADEFCTETVDSVLILTPGTGMDDWSPCEGESAIVLHHLGGVVYRFCMKVDPHDDKHPNAHTNFQIIFSPVVAGKQQNLIIGVGGDVGSSLHGGTAHSQN